MFIKETKSLTKFINSDYTLTSGIYACDLGKLPFKKITNNNGDELYLLLDDYKFVVEALAEKKNRALNTDFRKIEIKNKCCRKNYLITTEEVTLEIPESVREDLIADIVTPPKINDYSCFEKRLKSFEMWTSTTYKETKKMAVAGFYYTGIGDVVRCFRCNVLVYDWKVDDIPIIKHKCSNYNCPFVSLEITGEDEVD